MCGHEEDGAGVPRSQSPREWPVCDDCRQPYPPPIYYSVDEPEPGDDSNWHVDPVTECTGSLCPDCAGPYLEPDDPDDKRRPSG